jgi:hypothetical protein
MLENLRSLPENVKVILAISLSVVIVILVVVVLSLANQLLKDNLSQIRETLRF